jgi:hypothetical protein
MFDVCVPVSRCDLLCLDLEKAEALRARSLEPGLAERLAAEARR